MPHPTEQTQEQRQAELFERLKEQVLVKRPVLKKMLLTKGDKNLLDYANEYVDVNLNPTIPKRQNELLDVVGEVVEQRFGAEIRDSVINQLKSYYFVSTADHIGPIVHPFFVNSDILIALSLLAHPDPVLQNIIVLGCANVSVDNHTSPRGLFFHSQVGGKLQEHRLPFFSANTRPSSVYHLPPYGEAQLNKLYHELKIKLDKGEIQKDQYEKVVSLLREIYHKDELFMASSYAEQVSKTNFHLWKKLFQKSGVKLPNLIYLELEDIACKLIIKYHLYQDTVINHMLFDPRYVPYIEQYFENIFGSFSRTEYSGTYLFWALSKKDGKRLQLWREGNYLVSKDESYKIELHPETLKKAMEAKEIVPGLLLDFSVVSFYYGLKCLGGFNQVNYLTLMKNAYIRMNTDLENYRSIEMCARAQTKEICDGLTFAFLGHKDDLILASGLDLILYDDKDSWKKLQEIVEGITFHEALSPMMPEMYKISYDQKEWDPDLAQMTDKEISHFLGLDAKLKPCVTIPWKL